MMLIYKFRLSLRLITGETWKKNKQNILATREGDEREI